MAVLEGIQLRNFKGIREASVTFSPLLTVFVGPNNSGKSSVLQGIQAARCVFGLPIADPLTPDLHRYVGELVSQDSQQAEIMYRLALTDGEYDTIQGRLEQTIGQETGAQPRLREEDMHYLPRTFMIHTSIKRRIGIGGATVNFGGVEVEIGGDRKITVVTVGAGGSPRYLNELGIIKAAKAQSFSTESDGLPATGGYGSIGSMPPATWRETPETLPHYVRPFLEFTERMILIPASRHYPRDSKLGEEQKVNLLPDGLIELPRMVNLSTTDRRIMQQKLEAAVASVMPEANGLLAPTGGRAQADFRIAEREGVEAEAALSAWQVGSGLSHVVACLWHALSQHPGSLLAIEEPELSLHPGAQRRLRDQLLELARERQLQMVMTTHSPAFITGSEKVHAVACVRQPSGIAVRNLDTTKLRALAAELGVEPSDALLAGIVVVVEGSTEKRFYDRVLNLPGSPFRSQLYEIVDLAGVDSKLGKHLSLLIQTTPAATARYLLVDSAPKTPKIPDETGWTVKRWRREGEEAGEFEDQFSLDEVAGALTHLTNAKKRFEPSTLTGVDSDSSTLTSRRIAAHYEKITGEPLDKAAFGAALAVVIEGRLTSGDTSWDKHPALLPFTRHL